MIEILTLFVGLVTGVQDVEIEADDTVAALEIRLDGKTVQELDRPPWDFELDLGETLEPHRLAVLARDSSGLEIDRAERWINVFESAFEPPADIGAAAATAVTVRFESDSEPPALSAMRSWFVADDDESEPVALEPLAVRRGPAEVVIVSDPRIQPILDRMVRYWLEARMGSDYDFELLFTALFAGRETFIYTGMEGHRPIKYNRVELERPYRVHEGRELGYFWDEWHSMLGFGDETHVQFLSPRAAPVSQVETPKQVHKIWRVDSKNRGLLFQTVSTRPQRLDLRFPDAVAMAGLEAHASRRPRAVLLLLVDQAMGQSRYRPTAVREYLAKLQVPVFVWSLGVPASNEEEAKAFAEWGDVRSVVDDPLAEWNEYFFTALRAAFDELRQSLATQHTVWLEGSHLPQRVRLSADSIGVRLAGAGETGGFSR